MPPFALTSPSAPLTDGLGSAEMKPSFSGKLQPIAPIGRRLARVHMPFLTGIISNMRGADLATSDDFLVDTGAAITILGLKYRCLFSAQVPYDHMQITYGRGANISLQVFECHIKIAGLKKMLIKAAIDPNFSNHGVLGTSGFIEQFASIALVNKSKTIHFF
jgi:hypothetical protein